jgi:hypothetical protein
LETADRPLAAATDAVNGVTKAVQGLVDQLKAIEAKMDSMKLPIVIQLYNVVEKMMDAIDVITAPFDNFFFSFLEDVIDVLDMIK